MARTFRGMRALLIHPRTPNTYWGFQRSLTIAGKRASLPPLGLASLAALLPRSWEPRLIDLNVRELTDADLRAADVVLLTGMLVQAESMHEVLARCRLLGVRTIVGGPGVNTSPEEFDDADHLFVGEAEGNLELLIRAVENPDLPAPRVLSPKETRRPSMSEVPPPRFELIEQRYYTSMSLQYSRGCPFRCEFCDIIEVFGRIPRVKSATQVIAELDALFATGWRGSLFFVDDNFIGNRRAVAELLPELARWQRDHGWPFELYTEASVDLAGQPALTQAMVGAGFKTVFVGLESPSAASLRETGKLQNLKADPSRAVETLTRAGLEVYAGFIIGFDHDGPAIFAAQRDFIANLPIPTAMVGLLTALPGTALHRRLGAEGRLRATSNGDQFGRPNFVPALDELLLLEGYRELLASLYSINGYYARAEKVIEQVGRGPSVARRRGGLRILLRSMWMIGVLSPRRRRYWRLMSLALLRPNAFARAVGIAVQGEHLIEYTATDVLPRLERAIEALRRERARPVRRATA